MKWPFGRNQENAPSAASDATPSQSQSPAPPPAPGLERAPDGLDEGWFEHLLRETGFLHRYPQHAGVIASMRPIATDSVRFMAVGLRRWDDATPQAHLLVNPNFVARRPELVAGVLLHEVHHLVLGHLTQLEFHAVDIPAAMEVAMELSANEDIHEPLPPTILHIAQFARHGIAPMQSTMQRYALLAEAIRTGKLRLPDLRDATWDTHRPRQAGGRAIGAGDLLDARSDDATERDWRERRGLGPQSSSRSIERMRRRIAEHLGGDRGGGDTTTGTQRRVAKELPRRLLGRERSRLDWPRILREAFPQRRMVLPDYKRPNRRFPERIGELPGRTRRPPRPHLLAAIDTSGSMDIHALRQIAGEIAQLRRHARLSIVLCDAAAHRLPALAELDVMTGGGDTDFAPAFAELPSIPDCSGIVYFTDGRGELPHEPPKVPTLWVLTHDQPFSPGFGTIVRLPQIGRY